MPVFNGERFLAQALDSLIGQSFTDFELVISDNASTDGTESICRAYAARDERIRYFRNRANYGFVLNFNNAFRLSSGKYFKWAASDDVCGRDYLLRAVEVLDRDPSVVLAWGRTRGIDEDGNVTDTREISDLNSPGSMYSRKPTQRFRRLMDDIWWADGPFHGVIRSEVLAQTRLNRRHPSGDKILLAELCLRGRFYEIPEDLFFKRERPEKHSRPPTLRKRAEHVAGHPLDQTGFLWWRLLRQYPDRLLFFRDAIVRAPITRPERLHCYVVVLRQVLAWVKLRGGQVASGKLPWRRIGAESRAS
jgi:glycosyltransferase involved in cell wall biosynthesis